MKKIINICFLMLFATLGVFFALNTKGNVAEKIAATSYLAVGYVMVSVPKDGTNPGRSKPKKDKLIIFNMEDVDTDQWPERDEKGMTITNNIVMKAGKTAIELYFTPGTIKLNNKSEGDTDAKGYIQTIEFDHPGSALTVEEFLENNVNSNLGVLVQYCDSDIVKLAGSPCNPLQMEVDSTDDQSADKSKITLKSVQRGSRIAFYDGDLPTLDSDSGS